MIFCEHVFGAMTVRPGGTGGGAEIMTIALDAHHAAGYTLTGYEHLDRADVERLRDLCEEALK